MPFSDAFLGILGAWQNGWREHAERRQEITRKLLEVVDTNALPPEMRSVHTT